jgi:thiamine-phosphate pyrophosphorylase
MNKSVYRIIDANLNRSLEGLRVCEDCCRFILNNKDLALQIKQNRHQLLQLVKQFLFSTDLLDGRDVASDKTKLSDEKNELKRESLVRIINANIHRATEAIRSIEEYVKYLSENPISNQIQQIRFKLYGLEKNIVSCLAIKEKLDNIKNLYVIIDIFETSHEDSDCLIKNSAKSGSRVIHLALPDEINEPDIKHVGQISELCKELKLLLIIENSLELALLNSADGIVITKSGFSASDYRKIISLEMFTVDIKSRDDFDVSKECFSDLLIIKCEDKYPAKELESLKSTEFRQTVRIL